MLIAASAAAPPVYKPAYKAPAYPEEYPAPSYKPDYEYKPSYPGNISFIPFVQLARNPINDYELH